MKLIAKAKPIKIRIKSGGEEHSSLDSLRQNLCVQDLWPLIQDKRLERWLRQLGETNIAHDVDALSGKALSNDIYFKVLFLFMNKEFVQHSIKNIYSCCEYWHDCGDKESKNYHNVSLFLMDSFNGLKFIYERFSDDFTGEEWMKRFSLFSDIDPQILFWKGRMLFLGYKENDKQIIDKNEGYKLIAKAANKKCPDAIAFMDEYCPYAQFKNSKLKSYTTSVDEKLKDKNKQKQTKTVNAKFTNLHQKAPSNTSEKYAPNIGGEYSNYKQEQVYHAEVVENLAKRKKFSKETITEIERQICLWKSKKFDYYQIVTNYSTDNFAVREVKKLLSEFSNILAVYSVMKISKTTYSAVTGKYENVSPNDLFYKERKFVLVLAQYTFATPSLLPFEELANIWQYPLAQYMLNCPKDHLIDGFNFRGAFFPEQLSFIVTHLLVY